MCIVVGSLCVLLLVGPCIVDGWPVYCCSLAVFIVVSSCLLLLAEHMYCYRLVVFNVVGWRVYCCW